MNTHLTKSIEVATDEEICFCGILSFMTENTKSAILPYIDQVQAVGWN